METSRGYPSEIRGPEIRKWWRKKAERSHGDLVDNKVTREDWKKTPMRVWVNDEVYGGRAVIVATGADARWLGLPSEERLKGHGVSACATCDGFFAKGFDVASVGGGDTAMEESLYLAKLCKSVTIIHRPDAFRASEIMK